MKATNKGRRKLIILKKADLPRQSGRGMGLAGSQYWIDPIATKNSLFSTLQSHGVPDVKSPTNQGKSFMNSSFSFLKYFLIVTLKGKRVSVPKRNVHQNI